MEFRQNESVDGSTLFGMTMMMYESCNCCALGRHKAPERVVAAQQALALVKAYPQHHIVIGVDSLGKGTSRDLNSVCKTYRYTSINEAKVLAALHINAAGNIPHRYP